MSFQVAFLCESLLAPVKLASEGLFASVGALMNLETACTGITLPTLVADIGFVTSVD